MPRCNNMSLRCTKCKVQVARSRLLQNTDANPSRNPRKRPDLRVFAASKPADLGVNKKGKTL